MTRYDRLFYFLYVAVLLAGFGWVLSVEHGDEVLYLNSLHTPFLDQVFKYSTFLGDGVFLAVIAVIFMIVRLRFGLILALIGVVQAMVSGLMKRVIFGKVPRPKKYFEDLTDIHFVEGVKLNSWYSFPSGHTMTAFSIAVFLMFYFKKSVWSLALLVLACLAGVSRIYLFQHFLIDVLVGSAIGVMLSVVFYRVFREYLEGSKTERPAS